MPRPPNKKLTPTQKVHWKKHLARSESGRYPIGSDKEREDRRKILNDLIKIDKKKMDNKLTTKKEDEFHEIYSREWDELGKSATSFTNFWEAPFASGHTRPPEDELREIEQDNMRKQIIELNQNPNIFGTLGGGEKHDADGYDPFNRRTLSLAREAQKNARDQQVHVRNLDWLEQKAGEEEAKKVAQRAGPPRSAFKLPGINKRADNVEDETAAATEKPTNKAKTVFETITQGLWPWSGGGKRRKMRKNKTKKRGKNKTKKRGKKRRHTKRK